MERSEEELDAEEARRARHAEQQREYRKRHPDRIRAQRARWNAENPVKVAEIRARHNALPEHREAKRRARLGYYEKHKEQILAVRAAHRDAINASSRRTYAKKKAFTPAKGQEANGRFAIPAFTEANKVVPRYLPQDVREDVISAIVLAVLECRVRPDQIAARAGGFVRAHFKQFDRYKVVPLDVIIDGEDTGEERTTSTRLSDYQGMLASC